MKAYPSIINSTGQSFREFNAYIFNKIDGSNLRFEYSRKRGWYKYGTRNRLLDVNDEVFGSAILAFAKQLNDDLERVISKNRIEHLIVFAEFVGKNSFAGNHDPEDEKHLYLFDAAVNKKGIIEPKEFLKLFGDCQIAKFLGIHKWSKNFVEAVRRNEVEGVTFEGVVGKARGKGNTLIMAKAKTQNWIDKVKSLYNNEEAERLIKS